MGLQHCELNLDHAYRELQQHGTLDFPCAGYAAHYTDRPESAIPWHWHEEIELVYCAEGALKLQVPGKTFRIERGEGFAINSNILHAAAGEPDCLLHSLVFSPLLVAGNEGSVFASKYLRPLTGCGAFDGCALHTLARESGPLTADFTAAFAALSADAPGYEFTVREHLSGICLALFCRYEREIREGGAALDQDSVRVRAMLGYIHEHFAEEIGLADVARAADIGERECLRCFRRAIQISPVQYLLKYRVTQGAALLLREPGGSVAELAGRCGFDSPSNFAQLFKRFFCCTPREYRRKNQPQGAQTVNNL